MSRVSIAGATGYLGGFLLSEAKKRRHTVRALTRSEARLSRARGSVDETFVGEVTRPETLRGIARTIPRRCSSCATSRNELSLDGSQPPPRALRAADAGGEGQGRGAWWSSPGTRSAYPRSIRRPSACSRWNPRPPTTCSAGERGVGESGSERTGGSLKPESEMWHSCGCSVLDGWDPEGNRVRFKQWNS